MKRRSRLPNDPKIVVCICFGAFWICNKVLSYGRLTINFRIVLFTHKRWLFSYGITFLPDAVLAVLQQATNVTLKSPKTSAFAYEAANDLKVLGLIMAVF